MKLTEARTKQIILEEVNDRLVDYQTEKFMFLLREELAEEGIVLEEGWKDTLRSAALAGGIAMSPISDTGQRADADVAPTDADAPAQVVDAPAKKSIPLRYSKDIQRYLVSDSNPDLSNTEQMEEAWKFFDNARWSGAPVSGVAPVLKGNNVEMKRFVYVAARDIPGAQILPLSLVSAEQYENSIKDKLARNPGTEIKHLKNMLYGSTGKWLTGSGNAQFRDVPGSGGAVLPPEWSIAHKVYSEEIIPRVTSVADGMRTAIEEGDEEFQAQIRQKLGVETNEEAEKLLNSLLYSVQGATGL